MADRGITPDEQAGLLGPGGFYGSVSPEEQAWLDRVNRAQASPDLPAAARYTGAGAAPPPSPPASAAPAPAGPPAEESGVRGWLVRQGVLRPEADVRAAKSPGLGSPGTYNPGQAPAPPLAPPPAGPPAALPGAAAAPQAPAQPPAPMPPPGGGRPAGPSPGSKLLDTLDASDKRRQAALDPWRDAVAEARDESGNLAWGTSSANQIAIDRVGELQQQQQELMRGAQESVRRTRAEIDQELARIPPIDPNRGFTSKGAAEGVLMAIGVALGAAAQGISKGAVPNTAFQIYQSTMERDVEAQKANVQKQLTVLAKKNELLKEDWARSQVQSDMLDKLKIEAYEKGRLMIGGYAARAKSAEDRAKMAGLDAQIVGEIEAITQGMAQRRYQFAQAQAGGGGPSPQLEYRKYAKGQYDKGETPIPFEQWAQGVYGGRPQARGSGAADPLAGVAAKDRDRAVPMPDGSVQIAATKEDAAYAKELIAAHAGISAYNRQASEHRAKAGIGGATTSTTDTEDFDARRTSLAVGAARLSGVRESVQEGETERALANIPRANQFNLPGRADPGARLKASQAWADQKLEERFRAMGLTVPTAPAPGYGRKVQ